MTALETLISPAVGYGPPGYAKTPDHFHFGFAPADAWVWTYNWNLSHAHIDTEPSSAPINSMLISIQLCPFRGLFYETLW